MSPYRFKHIFIITGFILLAYLFSGCSKGNPTSPNQTESTQTNNTTEPNVTVSLLTSDLKVPCFLAVDKSGNVFVSEDFIQTISKITPSGQKSTFASKPSVHEPLGMVFDASGNLFVADTDIHLIRMITPGGVVTTFAGLTNYGSPTVVDGKGTSALFNLPFAIAIDATGNLFVADGENRLIRKITKDSVVTTIAGKLKTSSVVDGPIATARFGGPFGITVDPSGNIYVVDTASPFIIRKITPAGNVTTVFTFTSPSNDPKGNEYTSSLGLPGIVADNDGNLFIADTFSGQIIKMDSSGKTSVYLKKGSITTPRGIAIDALGNLYVTDSNKNKLYKVVLNK